MKCPIKRTSQGDAENPLNVCPFGMNTIEFSHIHLDKKLAKGTIRVSLGKNNTIQDAKDIADALIKILV